MLPTEDFTPLWARIGYFLGDAAWLLGMLLLLVAAIGLFRVGRHAAAKSLKLSAIALIGWVGLTLFGTIIHKAASHPALLNEIGFTGQHVVGVVVGLVGGLVDVGLFGLFCLGAVKAGAGVRALLANDARATPPANKHVAVPVPPAPAAPRPPAAARPAPTMTPDRPAPVAVSPPASALAIEERAATLETPIPTGLADTIVTAEERTKGVGTAPVPNMEAILAGGSFARPDKVFTLKEASRGAMPSLASREGAGLAELEDTGEISLSSLPLLAADDDEEQMREATLVEFPAVPARRTVTVR